MKVLKKNWTNITAAIFDPIKSPTCIATVDRAPRESRTDTEDFKNNFDNLARKIYRQFQLRLH